MFYFFKDFSGAHLQSYTCSPRGQAAQTKSAFYSDRLGKKNGGFERQRPLKPPPSSKLDIGESLSAFLQAEIKILYTIKRVKYIKEYI